MPDKFTAPKINYSTATSLAVLSTTMLPSRHLTMDEQHAKHPLNNIQPALSPLNKILVGENSPPAPDDRPPNIETEKTNTPVCDAFVKYVVNDAIPEMAHEWIPMEFQNLFQNEGQKRKYGDAFPTMREEYEQYEGRKKIKLCLPEINGIIEEIPENPVDERQMNIMQEICEGTQKLTLACEPPAPNYQPAIAYWSDEPPALDPGMHTYM